MDIISCLFGCLTLCGCRDRITEKMIFFPPQPPHYDFDLSDPDFPVMFLVSEAGKRFAPMTSPQLQIFQVQTSRRTKIATMYIQTARARSTLFFSHGNAADLGAMRRVVGQLALDLQVNIYAYDYSGYGLSDGKACSSQVIALITLTLTHKSECFDISMIIKMDEFMQTQTNKEQESLVVEREREKERESSF